MVGLLPIVPGLSEVVIRVAHSGFSSYAPFDNLRKFFAVSAVLGTGATIVIWRRFVLWTFTRVALTTVVALIPFAQVILPRPIWTNPGIWTDGFRLGLHSVDAGLWVWLTIWVWWGLERQSMTKQDGPARLRIGISGTARRVIASVGYVPFMFGLFWIILMALEPAMHNNLNSALSFAIMCSIAAILAILIWSAIWKGKVHGSGSFFGQSVRKAGLCMGVPILVIACLPTTPWLPGTDFLFVVPFVGWGAWMVWTVCGWPIALADGEETAPPRCPNCGYSLTGLRWTRCPECGDEPTLDELWRATARQEV